MLSEIRIIPKNYKVTSKYYALLFVFFDNRAYFCGIKYLQQIVSKYLQQKLIKNLVFTT